MSNGGADELTMMLVETLVGSTTQTAFGACDFTSFSSGIDTSVGKVMSNLPAMKAEDRGRAVGDDGELDAVEIGQALLPVIGVLA